MKKLVVLTGAGISADSGLKTFRDSDGLWEGHDIHEVAHPDGFASNPHLVLDFYNQRRRDLKNAVPNAAHLGLFELEKDFDVTVITQNVDDLHERGGSSKVLHLHGQLLQMRSVRDPFTIYPIEGDIKVGDLDPFGHQLRPHIVWFSEEVPMMRTAIEETAKADIFVVIGTSLQVYPAAGLLNFAPVEVPKFILDKSIPYTSALKNVIMIEARASEGIKDLKEHLNRLR